MGKTTSPDANKRWLSRNKIVPVRLSEASSGKCFLPHNGSLTSSILELKVFFFPLKPIISNDPKLYMIKLRVTLMGRARV